MNEDSWDELETPQDIFDALNQRFKFEVDACATEENSKCAYWMSDCLRNEDPPFEVSHKPIPDSAFGQRNSIKKMCSIWMNPPYSRGKLNALLPIARQWARDGAQTVCLVPSFVGDGWYSKNVWEGANVIDSWHVRHGPLTGRWFKMEAQDVNIELGLLFGRKKFKHPKRKTTGATFTSSVVAFLPKR
jgi:phage N-6-adenine-methyltransferase